jgi:hypothetical protein
MRLGSFNLIVARAGFDLRFPQSGRGVYHADHTTGRSNETSTTRRSTAILGHTE